MSNSVPSTEARATHGTARDFLSRGRKEVVPLMEEHSLAQKLAAEFIGTALLVFVGAGSVPAMILLTSEASPFSGAEVGMVALAFGLIVVAMVYTVGKVSGCHINPAVTFALAATKRFPWREVPLYWEAQLVGGVAGAYAMWASFGS